MPINNSEIKFYLTTDSYDSAQTDTNQSIGGYPSITEVSYATTLATTIGSNDTSITLNDFTDLEDKSYILINDEIIKVQSISSNSVTVVQRGFAGTSKRLSLLGSPVYGLSFNNLFNDKISKDGKQYRCLAVKNVSLADYAYGVKFYIKNQNLNPNSNMKIAIESPKHDFISSVATSGTSNTIVCESFSEALFDNILSDSILRITGGTNDGAIRKILSYDSSTKTIVVDSNFAADIESGDTFTIDPAPAQQSLSPFDSPTTDTSYYVSEFTDATNPDSAIGINVNGNRINGPNLHPNDVVYLWIERAISSNSEKYDDNKFIIGMRYRSQ